MDEEKYAKIKVVLPKQSKLLKYAAKVMIDDKILLIGNYEIKSHGLNEQPELVLHIPSTCFEIDVE